MTLLNVDLGILQETKLTPNIYMLSFGDFCAVVNEATSASQGGVALFWRENEHYGVKEVTTHGPSVIMLQLVRGWDRFHIVGCYIPPSYDNDCQGINTLDEWWHSHIKCGHCEAHLSEASLATYKENHHVVFWSFVLNRTL